MNIRLIPAPLFIEFEEYDSKFDEEYAKLGAEIDDPVGQYLKMAKAKGETKDSDKVVLELIVALHRKVDELKSLIINEPKELMPLKYTAKILAIGYEYFKIKEKLFIPNQKYYGRIDIPFFPQREVPLQFVAIDEQVAEIMVMHERDLKDYNAFVAARERAIIRQKKGIK
ncbi:MAG: hypothetical protein GXO40_06530 [Epsilonproteobacteria bacterium]|nr:hypothetical protein [Campylobacterota bacterium]